MSRTRRLSLDVQYASRGLDIPGKASIRRFCEAALLEDCSVTLRVVGRREATSLNAAYRGRNYPTNVLTFVYDEGPPREGDIAICAPVVRREAIAQGKPVLAHWAHLVVHGMLHLQGFDHERDADARRMQKRETQILADLGYPDPYSVAA